MLSLRAKILAAAAALVLLSQAGTVTAVLVTANRDVADRATRALRNGAAVLTRLGQSRSEQLGRATLALASDFGFRQAVAGGDIATIQSALLNHAARVNGDVALLFDEDGNQLASTAPGELNLGGNPAQVRPNANGIRHSALVHDGLAYELYTAPVRAPLPIAWLSIGYALDDEHAGHLRDLTGVQVSIGVRQGEQFRPLASSLDNRRRGAFGRSPADVPVGSVGNMLLGGEEHLATRQLLVPGDMPLSVVLTHSITEAMAPYRLLRSAAIVLGAIPLALALVGAVLLSRSLTQPVGRLVEAARRMQDGDYDRPVAIRTGDELEEFAVAFNSMREEIARRERRIVYQSRHDSLTGLVNRDFALERLDSLVTQTGKSARRHAVLVIDLHALADVESSLGHDVADGYLKEAANLVGSRVADSAIVARLETDSFLIILPDTGRDEARDIAERLLACCAGGVGFADIHIATRPAIGIAFFPDHGDNHDQLLLRAMIARDDASARRNAIAVYRDGDEEDRRRRMALIHDLRRATRNDELHLFYQPKIRVQNETVCGAEALVRWRHPGFGWLAPGEFIPILESSGNISGLTRWALTSAAKQCRRWNDAGLDLGVAVNLSAHDLLDRELPWFVHDLLQEQRITHGQLTVEITEEAMVRDFGHSTAVLRRLRELGVRVAIDDFGTGYSSLSQLKNLPVDELKIDRTFVSRLPEDEADMAIVNATVELAHNLGLIVVTEGIETGNTFRWIQRHGVEIAQGYYFSQPLNIADFEDWVRSFGGGQTIAARRLEAG